MADFLRACRSAFDMRPFDALLSHPDCRPRRGAALEVAKGEIFPLSSRKKQIVILSGYATDPFQGNRSP